jgi:hypothetical protein
MCWDRRKKGEHRREGVCLKYRLHAVDQAFGHTHVSHGRKRARWAANPVMADESPGRKPMADE